MDWSSLLQLSVSRVSKNLGVLHLYNNSLRKKRKELTKKKSFLTEDLLFKLNEKIAEIGGPEIRDFISVAINRLL